MPRHYSIIKHLAGHILLFFFCLQASAQNVAVNGKAHSSYAGKLIELYTATDYITGIRQKESADTVDGEGYFELSLHTEFTQPVFLKVGNVVGQLYVQPDFVYGITLPELDQDKVINPDVELQVNIGVIGRDSTELNALIFDYQTLYTNMFIAAEKRYLSRVSMFKRIDSLEKLCSVRYASVSNPYFKTYVQYAIASVNASLSRGEDYLIKKYIVGRPIEYKHYEYMQFFNTCFKGYLDRMASRRRGQSLHNIINVKADYPALLNYVRFEKDLPTDSLRELVILRNLWDYHFSAEYSPDAVAAVVSVMNTATELTAHKKIAGSMLTYFNKLQAGSKAPDFSATARDGKTVKLSLLKGRWIYLNFFSTGNLESLKEMPKIATLKKKYGDKLVFVSVCLDDTIASFKKYLAANPRFDWPILYGGKGSGSDAKTAYAITGTEGYFFINNFGNLVQSPATPPSKGFEYRANAIFKVRQKNTRTGIR